MIDQLLFQVSLIFFGALIGFLIPKFFNWKDEQRKELINTYSDLLKNCYGRLHFVGFGILRRVDQNARGTGSTGINIEKSWILVLEEVYSSYYHELDFNHSNTHFLTNYNEIMANIEEKRDLISEVVVRNPRETLSKEIITYFINNQYASYLKLLFREVEDTHFQLTRILNDLRGMKSGLKKNILFYFPFRSLPTLKTKIN